MDSELVTGPDGSSVDITISAEQPPDVDPRIIGTYNGDGSMKSIRHQRPPGVLGAFIGGSMFIFICTLSFLALIRYLLGSQSISESWKINALIISSATTGAWLLFCATKFYHYICAWLRYRPTPAQATYWLRNKQLRQNGRTPHSKPEFLKLLELAQELDRVMAPAYIAEQTANHFAQLTDERGLWSRKASSAWLGPTVLQRIMDEQHPSNDPDDEMSSASEE